MAYASFGTLNAARDNAVLLTTSYGADYHVYDFVVGPGKAFDPARDFVVITEMFGNGVSSSPSNTPAPHAGPDFRPADRRAGPSRDWPSPQRQVSSWAPR